ncbi:ATP-binding protein [Streptomyces laurentii]|uniref:ATP-binding protein n=1 Tax=Streptomyces laurentii TaxID=39478 RepID=UPI0033EA9FEE
MPAHHQHSFPVTSTASAVREARHHVVATIGSWNIRRCEEWLDGIELVAGELIANAVLHAGAGPITVDIRQDEVQVFIAVHDPASALPQETDAGPHAESGRGLQLVDAFADRCGAEPTEHGKRCWAAFDLPSSPDPQPGPWPRFPSPSAAPHQQGLDRPWLSIAQHR